MADLIYLHKLHRLSLVSLEIPFPTEICVNESPADFPEAKHFLLNHQPSIYYNNLAAGCTYSSFILSFWKPF